VAVVRREMFAFEKGRIRFIQGGRYPQCHSLFIDDKTRAVIDASSNEETLKAINRERPIDVLIGSHCHEDHVMYNYLFPEAELWAHEAEAPMFRDINGIIGILPKLAPDDREFIEQCRKFMEEVIHFQPREPDRFLIDGERIDFGETVMEILHTPGHSPGHLAFYFPEEKVLFLADLDLVKAGPYYGDPLSDIDQTIESCHRLAGLEADVYLTSHGRTGIYDGNPEYIFNYLKVIDDREDRLLEFLTQGPRTLEEISDLGIIYQKRSLGDGAFNLDAAERAMMLKHLERLAGKGVVQSEDGRYHLVPV